MPTTLLTGSNGFVGSTVLLQLLDAGHKVVAPVRSVSSGEALLSHHPGWPKSRVNFVHLPDFTVPGAFNDIFEQYPDIEYIVHVAAPILDDERNVDFVENFEKPSVLGNLSLLRSAKDHGKNVKAIAVTGSINAITTGDPHDLESRTMTSSEWLPMDREDAIKAQNSYISYCVGKKLAEKAIWRFVEEEKPKFSVTNFNPPLIFGPPMQVIKDVKRANFSTAQIFSIFDGSNEVVPPTVFPAYIDVRDLSKLHIEALTNPAAANKRFVVGSPMRFQDFADQLGDLKELRGKLAKDNDEQRSPLMLDVKAAEDVFGLKYRSIKETAVDTARAYIKLAGLDHDSAQT